MIRRPQLNQKGVQYYAKGWELSANGKQTMTCRNMPALRRLALSVTGGAEGEGGGHESDAEEMEVDGRGEQRGLRERWRHGCH